MVKEPIDGPMEVNIQVNGLKAQLKALGLIFGLITENLKEVGKTINCMAREFIIGLMGENMMVIM